MRQWLAGALALCSSTSCLEAPPDAAPTCGTVRSLSETFESESPLWEQHSSTVSAGALDLEAGPDATSWVITPAGYLLEGGELTTQFRRIQLDGDAELHIYLVEVDDDSIGLVLQGSTLSVAIDSDGDETSPASTAWDEDQLWWRVRQTYGRFEWAISVDGVTWMDQEPVASPVTGPVVVLIEAYGGTAQATAQIEAVNPGSEEEACPVSSVVDDFATELPRWVPTGGETCEVFSDSALHIRNDQPDPCGLYTIEEFDLQGSSVGLEVMEAGDCDLSLSFAVALPAFAAELRCLNVDGLPKLIAGLYGDDIDRTFVTVDFDPLEHHYWRIANPPGTDNIEMSVAGLEGQWRVLGTQATGGAALDRASIDIFGVDESMDGVVEELLLDNLNLVPP